MSSSLRPGHLLSALGAVLLGAALWLPWYAVQLPAALGSGLEQAPRTRPCSGSSPAGSSRSCRRISA